MRRLVPAVALAMVIVASASAQTPLPALDKVAPPQPSAGPAAPAGVQFLYGSGEGAANTRTVWHALVAYVASHLKASRSVVLAPNATLDAPEWTPCAKGAPLAAVFDVDETVLLNLGFEYDATQGTPYSNERWQQWEVFGKGKAVATPGALDALAALRAMHVTVIFNTNRFVVDAPYDQADIEAAGLGPAQYTDDPAKWREQTLYLARSPHYPDTGKDPRRATIASHYCVIAMGGDQLGDFSDLFNLQPTPAPLDRRALTDKPGIADLWGNGWFVFPNPAYGAGLAGSADQVIPADRRWPAPSAPTNPTGSK